MRRLIDYHLKAWKSSRYRMPLLLRGARQTGKTYAVRALGETYENFVEVNFELNRTVHDIFNDDLDPKRIINELALKLKKTITPGKTLLFFDEIQAKPDAITALRYFYEMMPELHIVAAGSLLDFAIDRIGLPVGRIETLYVYPMSFIEFLVATEDMLTVEMIFNHPPAAPLAKHLLNSVFESVGHYMALGGMPSVVDRWCQTRDALHCTNAHSALIEAYRNDFGKYARQAQVPYVELLFEAVPRQVGQKFKFSAIAGDFRKRELAPALQLLETAGVVHKVFHSSSQGIPIGAQIDPDDFKVISLDVGVGQAILGLDVAEWFLHPEAEFINKGGLVEAFVGQEMLAYSDPRRKKTLCYWHRESRSSQAEVDYVATLNGQLIPIEVKAGSGRTLKSMQSFLEIHSKSSYGIRFSANNYSIFDKVHSYPLFAIAAVMARESVEVKVALESLLR